MLYSEYPDLKFGAIVGKFVVDQATNNGIGKRQGGVRVRPILKLRKLVVFHTISIVLSETSLRVRETKRHYLKTSCLKQAFLVLIKHLFVYRNNIIQMRFVEPKGTLIRSKGSLIRWGLFLRRDPVASK
jgi:hypothetical protein